jgi:hypothetical protein
LILWFTGYDWFQPISDEEDEAITAYLEGGGRLFLSSQDYLGAHPASPNPREFFGVAAFQESVTPTQLFPNEQWGSAYSLSDALSLEYGAYQNFSDGLIPVNTNSAFIWHDQGSLAGTATSGRGESGQTWRAVFWALPFETLPAEEQVSAMEAVIGQLSDLGDSAFTVDRRSGPKSEPRVFTLTLTNSSDQPRFLWVTNALPANLWLHNGSEEFTYDREQHLLQWEGIIRAGESRVLEYSAGIGAANGQSKRIDNTVTIRYAPIPDSARARFFDHFTLTRTATTWVNAPDLTDSTLGATADIQSNANADDDLGPLQVITYFLTLRNSSPMAVGPIHAAISFPASLGVLEESIKSTAGAISLVGSRLLWTGRIGLGATVTSSIALTQTAGAHQIIPAVAYIDDGVTGPLIRSLFFAPLPYRSYWPVVAAFP